MNSDQTLFDAAIRAHDEAVRRLGTDIWVGAEPTFTNRLSESPEWLTDALGETKQASACHLIQRLRERHPGSLILRTLGRQYPREPGPRWSLGLYQRRDGARLAEHLPEDPLSRACACEPARMTAFWQALTAALDADGWSAIAFEVPGAAGLRILLRCDGRAPDAELAADPRCARASPHAQALPADGVIDELAAEGLFLVALGVAPTGPDESPQPCLELPDLGDVARFIEFTARVAHAARQTEITELVWRGFPPPVDATVAWTTLTPDPAVLEINGAPARNVTDFLAMSRTLYALAQADGLAPYRLQYNGNRTDSGGGGQFTLGGPDPRGSPFFMAPQLLARLVIYLNRHPALSYWFAPPYVGSFSQSPRADENVLESFSELQVALQHLAATAEPSPEFIWRSLSPFLVDTSGNAHRSELNIEKLWNPWLPGRGCLGLVEFRAFRMAIDAETAASIAALLRAVAAMLSQAAVGGEMIEWAGRLHDRFALPFYLRRDLGQVFDDLATAGLELGAPIRERLLADDWRLLGRARHAGCELQVEQAIEFWPLLGDAAQHSGGSRLVDASTSRLQVSVRLPGDDSANLSGWRVLAGDYQIPLREERDEAGVLFLCGVRYRAFVPWTGLHPGLGAQTPIVLTLIPPGDARALRVTLHDWQPQGKPYDGLPASLAQARRRMDERFVVEEIDRARAPAARQPPVHAVTDHCLDLRRC